MSSDPSAGVRLEVAILAQDQPTPAAVPLAAIEGEPARLTVLVVSAEFDVRCYVRECLRNTPSVSVLEAATIAAALTLAAQVEPDLLIVDAPQGDVIIALPGARAVVLVDDVPRQARPDGAQVRFLARPFVAHQLVAEVERMRPSGAE